MLAFVQAGLVLIASLYVWFFASVADLAVQGTAGVFAPGPVDALATEGTALAIVQLVSFVLLVAGGIRALNARTRTAWRLLSSSHAVQVVLSLYWAVRLSMIFDDVPGPDGEGPLVRSPCSSPPARWSRSGCWSPGRSGPGSPRPGRRRSRRRSSCSAHERR